jgi:hypothetical protein
VHAHQTSDHQISIQVRAWNSEQIAGHGVKFRGLLAITPVMQERSANGCGRITAHPEVDQIFG